MAVVKYKKLVDGKEIELFRVKSEAMNQFTRERVWKTVGGFTSEMKAHRADAEIKYRLRTERPGIAGMRRWGQLVWKYLEDFEENCRGTNREGFSPKVIQCKKSRLKRTEVWNHFSIEMINGKFVKDELDRMENEEEVSRTSTVSLLKEVKAVLSFAVHGGALVRNPLEGMSRKAPSKRLGCLTLEESNKLLSEAKLRNHPFYLIWLMSLMTGMRRSELAGLKWSDFDWEHRLVKLGRQDIPREGIVENLKNKHDRMVALSPGLVIELKKAKLKAATENVIEFDDTQRWFRRQWRQGEQAVVLRDFCREIGITEVTHHTLRATFITLALADNVPVGKVKEMVGHSSLKITDRYFRLAGLEIRGSTDHMTLKIPGDGGEVLELSKLQKHQ